MSLQTLLMISAPSFLLLHVWQKRWSHRGAVNMAQAGFRAGLEYLRTLALIATLIYTLLLLTVGAVGLFAPLTVNDLATAIHELQDLRAALTSWTSYWSTIVLLLLLAGMTIFAYRRGAEDWTRRARRYLEAQLSKARVERAASGTRELPPTDEMKPLLADQRNLRHRLQALESGPPDLDKQAVAIQLRVELEEVTTRLDNLDLARRIDPFRGQPAADENDEEVRTRESTITTFFVSRGLLDVLDRGARLILKSTLAVMCLALVAVSGKATADSVEQNIVVRLEALYLERSEQDALASYARAIPLDEESPANPELSDQDEEALDYLAGQFERSIGRALATATARMGSSRVAEAALNRLQARQEIIRVAAHAGQSTRSSAMSALSDADNLTRVQRESVVLFERGADGRRPRTELGQRFRRDLQEQFAQRAPSVWTEVRQRARRTIASFGQRASAQEFESRVLSQIFGKALDLGGPPTDELSLVARELANQTGSSTLQRVYNTARAQAFDNIANNETMEGAFARLAEQQREQWRTNQRLATRLTAATDQVPSSDQIVRALELHPPALRVDNELRVDATRLSGAIDDYGRMNLGSSGARGGRRVPEAVTEFGDYFPARADGSATTLRQELSGSLQPGPAGVSGMRGAAARAVSESASRAFARARNFSQLRGFSRIGGVLIGRGPENGGRRLDVRSLEWRDVGEHHLALSLRDGRDRVFEMGTFWRAVIHQALAYAADGRPIAVTMTTAAPLRELRILLHPALVDTALGCRIVALDRFVDEFTSQDAERLEMEAFVEAQGALYRVAWAARVIAAEERGGLAIDEGALGELTPALREGLFSAAVRGLAEQALENGDRLGDARYSILAAKANRFDEDLVEVMTVCGVRSASLSEFELCVGRESVIDARPSRRWLELPPEFTIWSGVREVAYGIDEEFGFLNADDGVLGPLEFMLQVAFVDSDEDDSDPWEFPTLAEGIEEAVVAGVRRSEEHQDVLRVAREFTVLQRLFRTGLDGTLGDDFPFERMVELATVTADSVEMADTLRWNARPGALEFSLAIELIGVLDEVRAEGEWQREMVTRIRSCVSFIESSEELTGIDREGWEEMCGLGGFRTAAATDCSNGEGDEDACYLEIAAMLAEETAAARELRSVLGVGVDDELVRARGDGCPAIGGTR